MIYNPAPIFNVKSALTGAFVKAGQELAIDFLAEENKPWTYYVGSVLGHAASATGIPGAAAVIYVIGDTLDFYVLKTPEGSDVRVLLNGVQQTSIPTFAATEAWELITGLVLTGNKDEITFVNDGPASGNTSDIAWMSLGPVNVVNGTAQEALAVPYNLLSVRVKDSELDSANKSIPIYLPQSVGGTPVTLAQYQAWSDLNVPKIDKILDSQTVEIQITLTLTLPGSGIKTSPANNIVNERGGLLSFSTTGPRNDSLWFPGFARSLMPGDTINTANTDVAAVVTLLTTATTAASIRPLTSQDYEWAALLAGKRAYRR